VSVAAGEPVTSREDAARQFLREPIWSVGTPQFEAWVQRCRALSKDAPQVFLNALSTGDEQEQYSALLALRQHGYESLEVGYGPETVYRVRPPNADWLTIKPVHPPQARGGADVE
jgi:hypothetical protein